MMPSPTSRIRKDPRGWQASLTEACYSKSLERGLAILGCFTSVRPVLGVVDLSDELGMSVSTAHRYAKTLCALGYLEQDRARKYRLGFKVTDLGMSVLSATGLREQAHSFLVELRCDTSCTVSLGVLDGGEVLYVDRVRGLPVHDRCRDRHETDLNLDIGSRVPAYASSIGKLLLANLPGPEQDLLIQMPLIGLASRTITSRLALQEELDQIAVEVFAVEEGELVEGVHSIAVPVWNAGREPVAAVAVEAPVAIVSRNVLVNVLGQHLLATADHISARLGYRREDGVPPRSGPASRGAPRLRVVTG